MLQEISKISPEEKKQNEALLQEFRYAFLHANIAQLQQMLDSDGIFFGKRSKSHTIAKINKYFFEEKRIQKCLWPGLKDGFSVDEFPGEHVIEFRLMEVDPFEDEEHENYTFGDPPRRQYKEILFYLALRFKNGKICSLRYPKKVIRSITSLQVLN